ncbi:MAG: hypothetical protein QOD80_2101, partial [Verrucomicrobiota bacterium]
MFDDVRCERRGSVSRVTLAATGRSPAGGAGREVGAW